MVKRYSKSGAYQGWYNNRRWRAKRAAQLRKEPLCRICLSTGKLTPAIICDHIIPHKGDPALFWHGETQSLCKRCHDSDKQVLERMGHGKRVIGVDGWAIDE